jgi:hypothetical protein
MAANFVVLARGAPSLDSLDALFSEGATVAQAAYALSHLAVQHVAALDRERGLALFFGYWRETGSMDQGLRRAYGITLSAFEARWKRGVSRRYGLLSLAADLGVFALFILLLLAPFFVRRRRLIRERLAALRKAESAAEQRAVTNALTELLSSERDRGSGPAEGQGEGNRPGGH